MPALNHKPEEDDGTDTYEQLAEGVYAYKVKTITFPYIFRTGSEGMRLCLEAWNPETGRGFDTWENIVTSAPKAKWKLKEFCFSLGLDYDNPNLDSDSFLDRQGKAKMHREEGSKWLSVDSYLPAEAEEVDERGEAVNLDNLEDVPF